MPHKPKQIGIVIEGMPGVGTLRAMLNGIARQIRKGGLSPREMLKLLEHQRELREELKTVSAEILRRRVQGKAEHETESVSDAVSAEVNASNRL